MGKLFLKIENNHREFIENQKIFFVATSPPEGRINLSPKGMDTFRVIDENKVSWMNFTGSSNETAGHILQDNRMTIMFCSFEGSPLILRLYGRARAIHPGEEQWEDYSSPYASLEGNRQVFVVDVESVQSSCGFGVPLFDYKSERNQLLDWAKKKTESEVHDYWKENNLKTIDGLPTGIKLPE